MNDRTRDLHVNSHNGRSDDRPVKQPIEMEPAVAEHEIPVSHSTLASLSALAAEPGAEPCDIAEEAMPALVIGDLDPGDATWVHEHTEECTYCARILTSFEQCDSALDMCDESTGRIAGHRPRTTASLLGLKEAEFGFMDTPVGSVLIAVSDAGVCDISYLRHRDKFTVLRDLEKREILSHEYQPGVARVVDRLAAYFDGTRSRFDVPVDLYGVTDFTRVVLNAIVNVPYGEITTYGEIARLIGKPGSSRAVGNALGRNPVPVILPCHRVILSSGAMGWYTGGPDIKRTLLDIEGVVIHAPDAQQVSLSL